ncbi:MAG: HD domain-containing protein [Spirochaetaceae bacterium]|nr:HD domain-containing protein [Spirochaetaceae bacterium]
MSEKKKEQTSKKYKVEFFSSEKDTLLLAKVVSLTMFLLGVAMAITTMVEGNKAMVIVSFTYGPLFLLAFVVTTITKKTRFFFILGFILSFCMEFVFIITGGQEGFGIFWMCIITFFTFFTNRKRVFFTVNAFYLLFVILGFWSPLSQFCYQFSDTMRVRFPILYMIEFIFASIVRIRLSKVERNRSELFNELIELQDSLQQQVEERTKELNEEKNNSEKLLIEVTQALATTIDAKDKYTSGHSRRVAEYSKKIAELLGKDEKVQREIFFIALLHDIGKIGIPDEIINKRDNLTEEEFNQMKKHPEIGYEILKNITTMPNLEIGVRWHHERLDGKGYPDALSGDKIPEYARIISVADAYDAMTSNRSYRGYLPQAVARSELIKGSGTQFAPEIAEKMIQIIDADTEYKLHE